MFKAAFRNIIRGAVFSFAFAAAAATAGETIGSHAYWTAIAFAFGSGGDRTCAIYTQISGGGTVVLFAVDGKLHLGLMSPSWPLKDEPVSISIVVDGSGFSGTAARQSKHYLVTEVVTQNFIAAFLRGREMEVRFPGSVIGGDVWTVNLAGSLAAAQDMAGCLSKPRQI
jgi:hypothetical protein